MRRLLPLASVALLAGCALSTSVDTDELENDIRMRLITQSQLPSAVPGAPQSTTPPAVSVSCPDEVANEQGTRFRCSSTATRISTGSTSPSTPGNPGLNTPSAQTQRYEINARVVDDSGEVRWTARPVD